MTLTDPSRNDRWLTRIPVRFLAGGFLGGWVLAAGLESFRWGGITRLPGWEIRSTNSKGQGACIEIYKEMPEPRTGVLNENPESVEVLSAKDEVVVYGGAFQDKVILRRGKRVIDLGGEIIIVEDTKVSRPEKKNRTKRKN